VGYSNSVFSETCNDLRSRDSAIGKATGYGMDERGNGVLVPVEQDPFSSHPDVFSNGYRGCFPRGATRQGRAADYSSPTSAEVKKTWVCTYTPPYIFKA
jgi:hypothetical protein